MRTICAASNPEPTSPLLLPLSFHFRHRRSPWPPVRSNFSEALRVTTKAKSKFAYDLDDLYDRGRRLVAQSVECGVTLMRAHVEVDETVHYACVDAGLRLRKAFKDICHVQIAGEPQCFPLLPRACG